MKQPAIGRIHERITAIADTSYPGYVVQGETRNLMIDAGVNLLGPQYLAALEELLGDAGRLDYLFLTHSHWDHLGSAGYLKRHLPGLQVGAHERVAGLVRRPSVLERMNRLSASYAEILNHGADGEDLTLHPFEIDVLLGQGTECDLGGLTCRVYETPGHTRDSLAYYFPEIKALFPGDACGVLGVVRGDGLLVQFASSYQNYVDSLRFLITLEPEIVCLAHHWVLTHEEARRFLEDSLAETFRYRELIKSYLEASSGDVEETVRNIAHAEYDAKEGLPQERAAYLTNLTAQVKHIAATLGQDGA